MALESRCDSCKTLINGGEHIFCAHCHTTLYDSKESLLDTIAELKDTILELEQKLKEKEKA